MARLHLVLGYRAMDSDPLVIYCGGDAGIAKSARDAAVEACEFKCVELTEPQRGLRRFCEVKIIEDKVTSVDVSEQPDAAADGDDSAETNGLESVDESEMAQIKSSKSKQPKPLL